MRAPLLLVLTLLAPSTRAGQIQESFSALTQRDATTTAVWNTVRSRVHMPFIVDRPGGAAEDDAIDIGTGADGAFDSTTYSSFDTVPGTPSVVDLDTTRSYDFTSFSLPNGVTIVGVGTSALDIRVVGEVHVDGTIDLSGTAGQNTQAGSGSASSGGTTCCGGAAGGIGGGLGANGADGSSADVGNTGRGRGGTPSGNNGAGNGGGGGGGGGFSDVTLGTNGTSSGTGGAGGNRGAAYNSEFLPTLEGGSGGGGGAGYNLDQGDWRGAGGGAGGGILRIASGDDFQVGSTGSILANGGNGGTLGAGGNHAGAGGGGSGGAIVLFSAGALTNAGTVSATGGTGGNGGNGGDGGNGAAGRTRFEDFDGSAFVGTGSETPNPLNPGQVYYAVGSRVAVTRSYDTESPAPVYLTFASQQTTPGASTATFEVAASHDNFQTDDTGFLPTTSLSALEGRRYVRFRITLTSADRTTTPEVQSFSLSFFDGTFQFKYASCAGTRGPTSGGLGAVWVFLLLLPLLTRVIRRK